MEYTTHQSEAMRPTPSSSGRASRALAWEASRPLLLLDTNGTIRHTTRRACRLLDYRPGQVVDSNFFNLVHDESRKRIMWDLAEMAVRHRQQATWHVRIKTGEGDWEEYQVEASSQLHRSGVAGIVLELNAQGTH